MPRTFMDYVYNAENIFIMHTDNAKGVFTLIIVIANVINFIMRSICHWQASMAIPDAGVLFLLLSPASPIAHLTVDHSIVRFKCFHGK